MGIQVLINAAKLALTPKSAIAEKNEQLFLAASLRKEYTSEIDIVLSRLLPGKVKYQNVVGVLDNGMPWWFVCLCHAMEAGGKQSPFKYHLHCGDPLTGRTYHVPAGRPKANPGGGTQPPSFNNPYSWEESAIDALRFSGYDKITDWSIGNALWLFEKFNGTGYRKRNVNTPYVWSYTNQYGTPPNTGKYVGDGKFDKLAISKQPGCAAYLLRMKETGVITL